MKNCGDYLHHQVAEKNILGEMVKIVKKKVGLVLGFYVHVSVVVSLLMILWIFFTGGYASEG